MIETLQELVADTRQGSSLRLFVQAAREQAWSVNLATVKRFQNGPECGDIWSIHVQAIDGERIVWAEFAMPEGSWTTGQITENGKVVYAGSDIKRTKAIEWLANGPVCRQLKEAERALAKSAEDERKVIVDEILREAAGTKEAEQVRTSLYMTVDRTNRTLLENLDAMEARIQSARTAIEAGNITDDFGGGLFGGNHAFHAASKAAAERNLLILLRPMVEQFVGQIVNPWESLDK